MPRARVLVVDDSVMFRKVIADVLAEDKDVEVVGAAANGRIALRKIEQLEPDLVTLDLEMPVMDGLETIRAIRRTRRHLPVVLFSTLTPDGAGLTLEALAAGASDYAAKPSSSGGSAESIARVRTELLPKVRALCRLDRRPRPANAPVPPLEAPPPARVGIVAIGSSTGGPNALAEVLGALPAGFPVPVVVAQHMPPLFTRILAERLECRGRLPVREAEDGALLCAGTVLLAPGDRHMVVERAPQGACARLNREPPEHFCRPAVDPLFRSVARAFPGSALAVVLTGMGRDGTAGCDEIRRAGGYVIAQDEATSVVWGMPGSVAERGLAQRVLPLERIGAELAALSQPAEAGREP